MRIPGRAAAQELLVDQPLGEQHMRQPVEQGDVRAGAGPQVHVGVTGQPDGPRVGNDQPRPAQDALEQSRADHGMGLDRVGTHQ